MNLVHNRSPGPAGLLSYPEASFYSLIAVGIHLHPATLAIAFQTNPEKCILITDSIEIASMPNSVYPGHSQIPHRQMKVGNRVTIEGTDTLIGSRISIDECVRNLRDCSGCSLSKALRCASGNIATLMNNQERGILEPE